MHVTITGATGLLGANLAAALVQQGHTLTCTRRKTSRVDHLADLDLNWVEATLSDTEALTRAFEGAQVVYHCAAMVSILPHVTPQLTAANVTGTQNVLDAVRAARVPRLVHCSSVVACGVSTDGKPVTEDHPWNFDDFKLDDGYAITKRQSEELVLKAAQDDIDAVIVNPGYMIGPYDVRPSSGKLIVDTIRGKIPGNSTGVNSFVDVRDVAEGMIKAADKGTRGERYIMAGHNMSYKDFVARVAKEAGTKPPRFNIPQPLAAVSGFFGDLSYKITGNEPLLNSTTVRWGYCTNYIFSSKKAQQELGYSLRPIDTAIKDAITWFKAHDML